mmetsp:Transcript_61486/g.120698  ORF Transcript_61486/g.120698 Transcript_61486/m.120698 type:complete len:246 (+) Transcript_61486:938-1675(+)
MRPGTTDGPCTRRPLTIRGSACRTTTKTPYRPTRGPASRSPSRLSQTARGFKLGPSEKSLFKLERPKKVRLEMVLRKKSPPPPPPRLRRRRRHVQHQHQEGRKQEWQQREAERETFLAPVAILLPRCHPPQPRLVLPPPHLLLLLLLHRHLYKHLYNRRQQHQPQRRRRRHCLRRGLPTQGQPSSATNDTPLQGTPPNPPWMHPATTQGNKSTMPPPLKSWPRQQVAVPKEKFLMSARRGACEIP